MLCGKLSNARVNEHVFSENRFKALFPKEWGLFLTTTFLFTWCVTVLLGQVGHSKDHMDGESSQNCLIANGGWTSY